MRGRTAQHSPPSRSHSARRALCDREGSSRIGRRSREIIVPSISNAGALCPTRTTMVLMLVNLQGAAVIFRVGRHHHRGPFCEGRGLTHALTNTAPTDLTVATHSPLGAQPQSDRILRLPCGRLAPAAPYPFVLDTLKRACRSSSLQASRSARSALSGCGLPWALVRKHTPGSGTGAHGRNW